MDETSTEAIQNSFILTEDNFLKTYRFAISKTKLNLLRFRNWLPLTANSFLGEKSAYLVGKIMGDGNLDPVFTSRFIGQLEDLVALKSLIINNFSIEAERFSLTFRKARGTSYLLQVNDCLFGRFLYALGAPIGNKTRKEFLIPPWIKFSRICGRSFLQALFDDELATIKIRKSCFFKAVIFKLCKAEFCQDNLIEFLSQVKQLTESFSVKCGKLGGPIDENGQKDGTKTFSRYFHILGNRANVITFNQNIGFNLNSHKVNNLQQGLELVKNAGDVIRTRESTKEADLS